MNARHGGKLRPREQIRVVTRHRAYAPNGTSTLHYVSDFDLPLPWCYIRSHRDSELQHNSILEALISLSVLLLYAVAPGMVKLCSDSGTYP